MYVAPFILRSSDQLQSAQITSGVHFFGACDLLRGASSALIPLSSIGQNLQVRIAALPILDNLSYSVTFPSDPRKLKDVLVLRTFAIFCETVQRILAAPFNYV